MKTYTYEDLVEWGCPELPPGYYYRISTAADILSVSIRLKQWWGLVDREVAKGYEFVKVKRDAHGELIYSKRFESRSPWVSFEEMVSEISQEAHYKLEASMRSGDYGR